MRTYHTPAGSISRLYLDMLNQPHLLIAGTTGSGKSVVINGLLHTALYSAPTQCRFILIDPKRVELIDYKRTPHTLIYASEPNDILHALQYAIRLIDIRYSDMQSRHLKLYDGSKVLIIIDEMADLLTTNAKQIAPIIQRIGQIGRASKVAMIAGTQHIPTIPTSIRANFDARIGLRTRSAQDSRNIIGISGLERLPRYGIGYYQTPDEATLYKIPMVSEQERQSIIDYWTSQARRA